MFEDDRLSGFGPLSSIRHTSLLRWGTKTLLEGILEKVPDATEVGLWGRPELAGVTKEGTGREYNQKIRGQALFVNARAKPDEALLSIVSRTDPFAASSQRGLLAARFDPAALDPGVVSHTQGTKIARKVPKLNVPEEAIFDGYWDLVESNGLAIAAQAKHFEESLPIPRTAEVRGPSSNLMIEGTADIEGLVSLDARLGPIMIDKGAAVESFSRIMGPCYIGKKTRVYSALIGGGTSIFESCKVGGQVENSVIMPYSNKAHHGYVGDAYVGSWVNLGAGCTFSNLKNTYGNVRLTFGKRKVDSGMLKLGPAIGDMSKLSIGSMVYAGKTVGVGSQVSGLASSNVPAFTFYDSTAKAQVELLLESVIETQRRMMERRGLALGRSEEALVRRLFARTAAERRAAGVRKGSLG